MKKKIILALCMLTVVLCSCSNEKDSENVPVQAETTIDSTSSSISKIATTTITNASTSKTSTTPYEPDEIDEIISYIKTNNVGCGALYDFDKDGIPEIAEQFRGESIEQINYDVHSIKDGDFKKIGYIQNYKFEQGKGNTLYLYKNKDTGEYFYAGDYYWDVYYSYTGRISTNIYTFINDKMETTELSCYSFSYTNEDLEMGRIFIDSSKFYGKELDLTGYHTMDEINKLIGVEDYLSQFEKIEEPNLEPQWQRSDFDLEIKVREALMEYGF